MVVLSTGLLLLCYSVICKKKYSLLAGIAFILLIMGFQSNIDSDYEGYMMVFESGYQSRTADDEPLWDLLSYIFRLFGWYTYVFCLSLFQCVVIYRLSKKYNSSYSESLVPILFFFTYGMMLIQMTAMRQGLAMEICLLPYLFNLSKKKRIWPYLVMPIICAYMVHNSSIIVALPLFFYYLQIKYEREGKTLCDVKSVLLFPLITEFIFIAVFLAKQYIFNDLFQQISLLATANDMRLGGYLEMGNEVDDLFELSPLIVFYDAVMIFLSAYLFSIKNGVYKVFALMSIMSNFFNTLFFGMGSMPRLGYYFVLANLVTIPCLYIILKERYGKTVSYLFLLFCICYAIKTSYPFMIGTDHCQYGTYKFIFMN